MGKLRGRCRVCGEPVELRYGHRVEKPTWGHSDGLAHDHAAVPLNLGDLGLGFGHERSDVPNVRPDPPF